MNSIKKELNVALKYLSYKPRTEKEVYDYLESKDVSNEKIKEIINKLKELNYLNDENYASAYISNGISNKKSKKQITGELVNKGLCPKVIDAALLDQYPDYMELEIVNSIISKTCKSSRMLSLYQLKTKLNYKLKYKQFCNETINKCMKELLNNEEINDMLQRDEDKLFERAKLEGIKLYNKYSKKYDKQILVKQHTLNALLRKGYPSKLCHEIINELKK